jgi:microcompartment protein CcmK/EutM
LEIFDMKIAAVLMTALMAFSVGVTAFVDTADAGRRSRRNAAIGIGAGIATLAIIAAASSSRRAYANERRPGNGRNYCGRLLRRCNNGNDWACEKYETGGCTE